MNVLSLFDGISCGQIALERAGINVDTYWASEIKAHAIAVTQKHYPNTIQLGDVRGIKEPPGWIDLIMGGSPCKGISRLNQNQDGLLHKESVLFWEYVRLYEMAKEVNPNVLFLLENTMGQKEATRTITMTLKRQPIRFNSSLVSAQNRPRLYWTNIGVNTMPPKSRITTKDVFSEEMAAELILSEGRTKWLQSESGQRSIIKGYTTINPYPKASCITAGGHKKWNCNYILTNGQYRSLSISELEKLQTLPAGYCSSLPYSQAYDVIGDGWTIDIIAHIFKHIRS